MALIEGLKTLCSVDLRENIKKLTVPLLRIYGNLDPFIPNKIADILDEIIPYSYSVTIKQSAHAPFISQPQEFCKCLLEFKKLL